MPTDATRLRKSPGTSTRVHGHRLADDQSIGEELADRLARVGIADFADFIGIEPDSALAAA